MHYRFILLLLAGTALSGCLEESCEETRTLGVFTPEVVTPESWRDAIFFCGTPIDVCETTSFYLYEEYLFMVENGEGLHIFDNSDPAHPVPVTFMEVSGGQGLAVRNDILYMNQYVDLVAFDLSDPTQPAFLHRTKDVFSPGTVFAGSLGNGQFVTNWRQTGERIVNCTQLDFDRSVIQQGNVFLTDNASNLNAAFAGGGSAETVGQGGSLARFTISQGTLYAVDDNSLRAFDLSDPARPSLAGKIDFDWGIETIFPYKDQLYIGSTTGVHIFGVADPLVPEYFATFEHVLACDPVVVANDLAYVTLWGGRDCGSTGDQLEILDVSNPRRPRSLQITPMSNSHGLGVADDKLFLCAQWEGLKVFALNENGLLGQQLDDARDINARDVIVLPEKNELIVLGYRSAGIQQYTYSDAGALRATSQILVCQ